MIDNTKEYIKTKEKLPNLKKLLENKDCFEHSLKFLNMKNLAKIEITNKYFNKTVANLYPFFLKENKFSCKDKKTFLKFQKNKQFIKKHFGKNIANLFNEKEQYLLNSYIDYKPILNYKCGDINIKECLNKLPKDKNILISNFNSSPCITLKLKITSNNSGKTRIKLVSVFKQDDYHIIDSDSDTLNYGITNIHNNVVNLKDFYILMDKLINSKKKITISSLITFVQSTIELYKENPKSISKKKPVIKQNI